MHHIAGQSLIYCDDTCHFTFEKDIWGKNEAESNGFMRDAIMETGRPLYDQNVNDQHTLTIKLSSSFWSVAIFSALAGGL